MDLKTRAIKSTAWYLATRIWVQAVSWAATILLARLLDPRDYGLFGMAFSVIAFLELFQQLGLGAAIIQRKELTRRQINTVFWVVTGASALTAAIAAVAAAPVAAFYREPALVGMVQALAAIFLINALGMVPYSLLTREIDFRRRSFAESGGVVVGTGLALLLAYGGRGVWALVLGELARATVRNLAMIALCRFRPGLAVSLTEIRELLRFGMNVAGATLLRELSTVVNAAILGRMLGGGPLGLWSMAMTLGTNPFHKLSTAVINQLSLPVFSKVQDDLPALRRYYLGVTRYLALVSLPMQLGMALVATDFVTVVLSEKWHAIIPLLQVLAIGGIWYVLPLPSTPVLTARGRTGTTLRIHAVSFVVVALAFWVGSRFGLAGIALAWVVSFCALRTYLVTVSLAELRLGAGAYLANLGAPAAAAVAMVLVIVLVRAVVPTAEAAIVRLARDVALGACVYTGALLTFDRALGGEVRTVLRTLLAGSRT